MSKSRVERVKKIELDLIENFKAIKKGLVQGDYTPEQIESLQQSIESIEDSNRKFGDLFNTGTSISLKDTVKEMLQQKQANKQVNKQTQSNRKSQSQKSSMSNKLKLTRTSSSNKKNKNGDSEV